MSVFNRTKNSSHRKIQNTFPLDTLVVDRTVSSYKSMFATEIFLFWYVSKCITEAVIRL